MTRCKLFYKGCNSKSDKSKISHELYSMLEKKIKTQHNCLYSLFNEWFDDSLEKM